MEDERNVLEVRYKVISRQIECMNHTIASLLDFARNSSDPVTFKLPGFLFLPCWICPAGFAFAEWYSTSYAEPLEGTDEFSEISDERCGGQWHATGAVARACMEEGEAIFDCGAGKGS